MYKIIIDAKKAIIPPNLLEIDRRIANKRYRSVWINQTINKISGGLNFCETTMSDDT